MTGSTELAGTVVPPPAALSTARREVSDLWLLAEAVENEAVLDLLAGRGSPRVVLAERALASRPKGLRLSTAVGEALSLLGRGWGSGEVVLVLHGGLGLGLHYAALTVANHQGLLLRQLRRPLLEAGLSPHLVRHLLA